MAKSQWLQEVEDDAVRITEKRFKDFFDEQEYKKTKSEAKAAKVKPSEPAPEKESK